MVGMNRLMLRSREPAWARLFRLAAGVLVGALCVSLPSTGQTSVSGHLGFLIQRGLGHTEERRYSKAINALEEAWEQDPSNPIVAEHLALSYLYEKIPPGADALSKARKLMRFSLEHGGQVRVFVRHLHTKTSWMGRDEHCSGDLVLDGNGLHYRATLSDHSFSLGPQELESIGPAKGKRSRAAGGLKLTLVGGKGLHLRAGTHSQPEAELITELTERFLVGD